MCRRMCSFKSLTSVFMIGAEYTGCMAAKQSLISWDGGYLWASHIDRGKCIIYPVTCYSWQYLENTENTEPWGRAFLVLSVFLRAWRRSVSTAHCLRRFSSISKKAEVFCLCEQFPVVSTVLMTESLCWNVSWCPMSVSLKPAPILALD